MRVGDSGDADDATKEEEEEEEEEEEDGDLEEQEEMGYSTQAGLDGLTVLLILAAFALGFAYFHFLEQGQAPPMGGKRGDGTAWGYPWTFSPLRGTYLDMAPQGEPAARTGGL